MSLEGRHESERQKWDLLAAAAIGGVQPLPPGEDFHRCADRDPLLRGVSSFLGDLSGVRVLEYGCGVGSMTVRLARSGADVTAFDISAGSIEVARRRAEINDVADRVRFDVAPAEALPYTSGSFDVVFGKAVLHHLDLQLGSAELYRVLRKGGKAAFSEPMGMNPILNVVRDHLPYRSKTPRGADVPMNYDEINAWNKGYSYFDYREVQLLSMIERAVGFKTALPRLRRADDWLLTHVPRLRRFCRYVTIFMIK